MAALLVAMPLDSLPFPLASLAVATVLILPRARLPSFLLFSLLTVGLTALLFGLLGPHPADLEAGPLGLNRADFTYGAWVGGRLAGTLALFAIGAVALPGRELLPYVARRALPAYLAGALLRIVPALRSDAHRLQESQEAKGHRFRKGILAADSWRPLLVPLFVLASRRAREQAIALHLAGLGPRQGRRHNPFAPTLAEWATIVTFAGLAIAGRLVLLGDQLNLSFSLFVLFVAATAYGPRVGAAVGLLERLATDLVISGLNPIFVPLVLVEGLLGLGLGFLGRGVNFGQRGREPLAYAALLAATAGWLLQLAFSLASDTATWLFYAYLGAGVGEEAITVPYLQLLALGVLFNVPAMVFQAALFGAAAYPVLRALRASGALPLEAADVHAHA